MNRFNIRVYGILINDRNQVLLAKEREKGYMFTKFPGGGLEFGEGLIDCLKRELEEELGIQAEIGELFYLTDFFQQSVFHKDHQLISVYYRVYYEDWDDIPLVAFTEGTDDLETFFWQPLSHFTPDLLTFPVDKIVAEKLHMNAFPGNRSEHAR